MLRSAVSASVAASLALVSAADASIVMFKNTNPALQDLTYYQSAPGIAVAGQNLLVTADAYNQPTPGTLPGGSVWIIWTHGTDLSLGEYIYIGPGHITDLAIHEDAGTVIDPPTGTPIPQDILHDFDDGQLIGNNVLSNFTWGAGWVTLHVDVSTAPTTEGLYFTDDSFIIGLRFFIGDDRHFGFIIMERTQHTPGESRSIKWKPKRWGYESEPDTPIDMGELLDTLSSS